jgi:hypothetical protein
VIAVQSTGGRGPGLVIEAVEAHPGPPGQLGEAAGVPLGAAGDALGAAAGLADGAADGASDSLAPGTADGLGDPQSFSGFARSP